MSSLALDRLNWLIIRTFATIALQFGGGEEGCLCLHFSMQGHQQRQQQQQQGDHNLRIYLERQECYAMAQLCWDLIHDRLRSVFRIAVPR